MPYLILILGLLIALYAFIRFFMNADPAQIKMLFTITGLTLFTFILLYFALSGRIIISLALLLLSLPFVISYLKAKKKTPPPQGTEEG